MSNWQKIARLFNGFLLIIITCLMVLPQPVSADDSLLDLLVPFLKKPSVTVEDAVVVGGVKYLPNQEIVGNRTENGKTTYLGGSKYALDTSLAPVHYKDNYDSSVEQWKDIDLTIVDGKITKAPYELTINYDTKAITVRDKKTGSVVDIGLSTIDDKSIVAKTALIEKGRVTFKDIAIDTDIVIEATNSAIRFKRVLKTSLAPTKATFQLTKSGAGIAVSYQARDVGIRQTAIQVDATYVNNVLTENVDKTRIANLTYPLEIDPTIDVKVGASTDDEHTYNLAIYNNPNLGIGRWTDNKALNTGMRFANITIVSGAIVSTSYVTFTSDGVYTADTVRTKISAEQSNNAATFSTYANFIGRALTTAQVDWDFTTDWATNGTYNSGEIKTVVQELVTDYTGLSAANIVIFVNDDASDSSAYRLPYSYDGSAIKCPNLHIEYTVIAAVPTVTTNTTTLITQSTATLNGQIISGTSVTTRGFAWGTTSNATLPINENPPASYTSNYTETGTYSAGTFSYAKTGLTPSTTYYVRAYSGNATGYGWGDEVSFATTAPAQAVTTGIVTGFAQTWAILNEHYTAASVSATQIGFEYGLSSSYGSTYVTAGTYSDGDYSSTITGLSAATVYHYRATALVSGTWIYGEDKIFATKGSPAIYEYWNTGGDGDSMKINSANLTYQTFTTNTTTIPHSVTTIKLMLKKVGSPGTVRASIYNTVTPTTTTFSGSYITAMTARGFAWGYTSNATLPVKENPPASYTSNYTTSGTYPAGSWTYNAPTDPYSTYYYRSYSYNATGYFWSGQTTVSANDAYPTGDAIVYDELDGDTFSTSYTWYTFTFDTEKCLSANTTYAIVLRAVAGDASNYVMWQSDAGGGYGGGAGGYSITDGVSWVSLWPVDYLFEVWGNPCLLVEDAKVFSGYLATGDWLITLLYKNFYPPYYDQAKNVSDLFVLQLVNGSTVVASTKCFEWGYKPGSIYLAADQVTALDWGSAYKVRITATFSPYTYAEYSLLPADWQGTDLSRLDAWCRSAASLMETYYNTDFTTYIAGRGICLNSEGGVIFATCIPELDTVRPDLFSIISSTPTPDDEDLSPAEFAWQTLLGPQLTRAFTTGGGAVGIEGSTFGALIGFAFYVLVALLCFTPGNAIAAIVIPVPFIIILWGTGLAELGLMGVMLGVAMILFVWQVWWRGA